MWWRRAVFVWMLLMLLETLSGRARSLFLAPAIGDLAARQWGVAAGCALIFIVTLLTARWIGAATAAQQLIVGAIWALLTLVFEIALGRALELGWARIFSDYNPARGGFMVLGLAFMALAPWWVARLRSTWLKT